MRRAPPEPRSPRPSVLSARRSKFWLVMYSSACQRVHRLTRLPTLALPATAPTLGFKKCGTRREMASRRNHRVGVDADENLFIAAGASVRSRAPRLCRSWAWSGSALARAASSAAKARRVTSSVSSREPSSITMTRRLSIVRMPAPRAPCARSLSLRCKPGSAPPLGADRPWPIPACRVGLPQPVKYRQRANEQQAAGHQHIAEQKDPGDALDPNVKQPEADPCQPAPPSAGSLGIGGMTSARVLSINSESGTIW